MKTNTDTETDGKHKRKQAKRQHWLPDKFTHEQKDFQSVALLTSKHFNKYVQ